MTNLPSRRAAHAVTHPEEEAPSFPRDPKAPPLGQLWGMLIRRRWLIVGAVACTMAATAFFTFQQTPVFRASTLLRIQDKPNLPDIFRNLGRGNELSTEMGVLNSRALVEDAAGHVG